jgi:hypothetical protein
MEKPQLGELLVEHGVITPHDLTLALAEQQRTGRPLGEVVVALGLAPGPIVAQALATQHGGGIVKTEYGFAAPWNEDLAVTIARLRTRIAELEARLANPWAAATTHLLLLEDGERYELMERHGPPPAVGALTDGRRVTRVEPCAYLLD